jgi:hypothetical protein
VTGSFLDVAQWNARLERGGDERVAERVGSHPLGDPRLSGDTAHDPTGGVTVDPLAIGGGEDRLRAPFADRDVDGPGRPGRERDGHDLATLADDGEGAVAALESEVLDVGADGFGDSQPVECQHTDRA